MACFLVIIKKSNGESETLCWIVRNRGCFEAFKSLNPKWDSVRVTMADKDVKERRSVVNELFPSSALHICSFHTLQAFRREVVSSSLALQRVNKKLR